MEKARLILDKDFIIDRVDPRIYGSFIEHAGRAVYEGIYEPTHPLADDMGFRRDVLDLVRKLDVPVVRYPGGNFVSGFNWEDSIGPVADRPKRLDLAWKVVESNAVGLHEFAEWAKRANSSVMYAVNLGTRDAEAARNIVEYANHPGGTYWSDLRKKNGAEQPFDIKLWCLGNEMAGDYQMGHKTSYEYGRIANEAAKLMKWTDPTIEVAACGSTSLTAPDFGNWEYGVLDQCYENMDYISMHSYFGPDLGTSVGVDWYIESTVAVCDAVMCKKRSKKKINIAYDEWNCWYRSVPTFMDMINDNMWADYPVPHLEDVYSFRDSLVVATVMNSFLRHADRVKVACMAQLVNVIAPIMTRKGGGAWAQTIFYPMMYASRYGRGISLRCNMITGIHDTKRYERVPNVDAAAVLNDDGTLTVFAVNRRLDEDVCLELDVRSFGKYDVLEQTTMHHDDPDAINTEENPDNVAPVELPPVKVEGDRVELKLGKASWNVIRLKKA